MGRASWMFDEWPERTMLRDRQLFSTHLARALVPFRRQAKRFLDWLVTPRG